MSTVTDQLKDFYNGITFDTPDSAELKKVQELPLVSILNLTGFILFGKQNSSSIFISIIARNSWGKWNDRTKE
jgi:hypothetical protein